MAYYIIEKLQIYYNSKKINKRISVMIIINTRQPVFIVLRNKPSLDLLSTSLVIGSEGLIGKAHLGHFSALSDTSLLHSGQFIRAIFVF
jgi:hypothetical protein|tara:strand:- start:1112 stop:1378 length:267 start_codon:yes stop_codon:yes gene_type:complete